MHRHHIIPRHAGGGDEESNIILLTVEEHAEAHRLLYEMHGKWQDCAAWLGLTGQIGKEELIALARKIGWEEYLKDSSRTEARARKASESLRKRYLTQSIWITGLTKESDARVRKLAASVKAWYDSGGAPWNKGKTDCIKISENVKRQAKEGNFHCIGDYQRGRTFDLDHRAKLSDRAQKRVKQLCEHCGIIVSPAMFKRWHGDRCKGRR